MDQVFGCETTTQKVVAAGLVLVALLITWYVYMFLKDSGILPEGMCGGCDQQCRCAGNETFHVTTGKLLGT